MLKPFLSDALNWPPALAGDQIFEKHALSASLAGNHLHIVWAPPVHSDWSREDVYFDATEHLRGKQIARYYHGTEFEHFGVVTLEAHRASPGCLGPKHPDRLWGLLAFPDG